MGRLHSEWMKVLFPYQKGNGIDLGNIDIKESYGKYNRIELDKKDMKAEYFFCYNHQIEEYLLVDCQDIPLVRAKRSFSWKQLKRISIFKSKNEYESIVELNKVSKFPELTNKWL